MNVAHPKPHSFTPIAPAAVAATDRCAHAADKFTTVTPSPHPGTAKRKLLTQGDNKVSRSRVKPRKGFTKITLEIREKLNQWILGHPQVIQSPITNDTLLIRNRETGVIIRVSKLLIEISIRELHNSKGCRGESDNQ